MDSRHDLVTPPIHAATSSVGRVVKKNPTGRPPRKRGGKAGGGLISTPPIGSREPQTDVTCSTSVALGLGGIQCPVPMPPSGMIAVSSSAAAAASSAVSSSPLAQQMAPLNVPFPFQGGDPGGYL